MRANLTLGVLAAALLFVVVLAVPRYPPRDEQRAAEVIEENIELLRDVNKVLREALLTTAIAGD